MKTIVVEPMLTGSWSEDVTWEFYLSHTVPPVELCTAAMCVPLVSTGEVVMTQNRRGWELPGGHIEPGESVEEAMLRELMEEVGYIPETYHIFGYRKVYSSRPIPHAQREGFYPSPISYVPYYVATSSRQLVEPIGSPTEVFGARLVDLAEDNTGINEEFIHIARAAQRAVA